MNNYSKQREIVLNVIKDLKHPTAEEVYNKVHNNNPNISKSTVYRNLNVLLENKIIKKIKVLNGPDKYDYIWMNHYHVICKICGSVFDFKYDFKQVELEKAIYNETGVTTSIDSIILYGVCEKCKLKESRKEE